MTARAETKTQALRAAETARPRRKSADTPRLMRADHSCSPEKPRTPARSKEDEQEEVNALDLESLQLQDKEIAPEKLTKLEKVGSGGFKVRIALRARKEVVEIDLLSGNAGRIQGHVQEEGHRDRRHSRSPHRHGRQRARLASRSSSSKHCSLHWRVDSEGAAQFRAGHDRDRVVRKWRFV